MAKQSFTEIEKSDAVKRFLKGETATSIKKDINVSNARFLKWRESFIASGFGGVYDRRTLQLTKKKHRILELVAVGYDNTEIAKTVGLSYRTVEGHRDWIIKASGCNNMTELLYRIGAGHIVLQVSTSLVVKK